MSNKPKVATELPRGSRSAVLTDCLQRADLVRHLKIDVVSRACDLAEYMKKAELVVRNENDRSSLEVEVTTARFGSRDSF